ncbi:MAG: nicotinamide-nucleotide amidohydrolase family protein [Verrucomicrobia bacterium]|jgi:PncC family amidohydrolase|nr:nicotinamide-nucleotide amidohydrolase family protein [Verrucomicrobiota bacterium]MBT7066620.1 nicotinamide-nucleotide amidohydrolase family protein [Verrucomicrobiota bacterium]MBT7699754.1 nicotinamide-nucleotide amidohydrolase family protein [Verrucomicrobiota bacterium]
MMSVADSVTHEVGRMLTEQGLSLSLAESCTGGLIAHRITMTPGSSAYFLGGVVSYANSVKQAILGVEAEVLAREGAVSEAVAAQMAAGVRDRLGADIGISVTGIAGPGGGVPEKPVGLVFMGFANPRGEVNVRRYEFSGNRLEIKEQTCAAALEWLQAYLKE